MTRIVGEVWPSEKSCAHMMRIALEGRWSSAVGVILLVGGVVQGVKVVFGEVDEGMDVLRAMVPLGSANGSIKGSSRVLIADCGELHHSPAECLQQSAGAPVASASPARASGEDEPAGL